METMCSNFSTIDFVDKTMCVSYPRGHNYITFWVILSMRVLNFEWNMTLGLGQTHEEGEIWITYIALVVRWDSVLKTIGNGKSEFLIF